jgi:hypothetical protein
MLRVAESPKTSADTRTPRGFKRLDAYFKKSAIVLALDL